MKKINWATATQIKSTVDQETPFKEIQLPTGLCLKLYHVSKNGMYGWQVLAVLYGVYDMNSSYSYKTSGCGYSKENHALECVFRFIGKKPREFSEGGGMPWKYHVGGNFYKVAKKDWMKNK